MSDGEKKKKKKKKNDIKNFVSQIYNERKRVAETEIFSKFRFGPLTDFFSVVF